MHEELFLIRKRGCIGGSRTVLGQCQCGRSPSWKDLWIHPMDGCPEVQLWRCSHREKGILGRLPRLETEQLRSGVLLWVESACLLERCSRVCGNALRLTFHDR